MTFDKIKLDRRAVGRYLKEDVTLRDALRRKASRVAAGVRRDAPVDTGDYKKSIHVDVDVTDRQVARVISTDPKALLVEADTGVMLRALDAEAAT